MENIEIFDKYINGELSEKERQEFDNRLETDNEFKTGFQIYSTIVIGICQEGEQNDKDFEMAMKNISEDKLREIIGKREPSQFKSKKPILRPWMWQVASYAAIIIIAVVTVIKFQQNSQDEIFKIQQESSFAVDNALYACAYIYEGPSRSTFSIPNLNTLSDTQLEELIPKLKEVYDESNNMRGGEVDDDLYEYGYPLAMAYLRLHERDKAKDILNNLIAKLADDEDYAEEISKLKSIANALK